jgi:hypothetical protein
VTALRIYWIEHDAATMTNFSSASNGALARHFNLTAPAPLLLLARCRHPVVLWIEVHLGSTGAGLVDVGLQHQALRTTSLLECQQTPA